MLTFLAPW